MNPTDHFDIAKIVVLQITFNAVLLANVFYLYWRLRSVRAGARAEFPELRKPGRAEAPEAKPQARAARPRRTKGWFGSRVRREKTGGLLRLDLSAGDDAPENSPASRESTGTGKDTAPGGRRRGTGRTGDPHDLDALVRAAERAESRTAPAVRAGAGPNARDERPERSRAATEMTEKIRRLRQGLDRAGRQSRPAGDAAARQGVPGSRTSGAVRSGSGPGTPRANRVELSR